jgi:hypothetical protein
LSSFQFVEGRIGRGENPPPQFGHTSSRTFSTQLAQNVHSNEQMRASGDAGGRARLQCSQLGRSSSTTPPFRRAPATRAGPARRRRRRPLRQPRGEPRAIRLDRRSDESTVRRVEKDLERPGERRPDEAFEGALGRDRSVERRELVRDAAHDAVARIRQRSVQIEEDVGRHAGRA